MHLHGSQWMKIKKFDIWNIPKLTIYKGSSALLITVVYLEAPLAPC